MLREAGFEEQRVLEALGVGDDLELPEARAVAHLRPGRIAALAALLFAGAVVAEEVAAEALGPLGLEELVDAGVLVHEPEGARATVRIEEYAGLLVASDRDEAHPAHDYVLEVGPSTRQAAALTVRQPVERALDACSGSGLQALLLRGHAERVVGTEISPRAVDFARFNAALNDISGVDWRLGNLLDPVEGESFGAVVCNPPYVIGPADEPLYRDGRAQADELSRSVATGAARLLAEGGFATVVCNWISTRGESWHEPPERWLDGCGCDLLLLRLGTHDAIDYAASWSSWVLDRDGRDAYLAAVERRRDHLRGLGAEAVTAGVIVLRRRAAPVWRRREDLVLPPTGAAGAQLLRVFEAQDFLTSLRDDRELLDAVLEPASGVRLVRSARYGESGYEPRVSQLALDERIGLDGRFPTRALTAVEKLDGRRSLREALGDSADGTLPALRELYGRGFLTRRS